MKRIEIKRKIKELKDECMILKHSRLKKDRERREELPLYLDKLAYFTNLLKEINNIDYEIKKEYL